jgi:hypothetical protein
MRYCPKCKTDKAESEFYLQKKKVGPARLSGYCRLCMRVHYLTPRKKKVKEANWAKQLAINPTNLPGEVWLPIEGYDDMYEVSNLARIRSTRMHRCKILKTPINKHLGYRQCSLGDEGKFKSAYLHRLVAEAFVLNPMNWDEINHIDGDKANSLPSNLEWCTHKQNMHHAIHVLERHGSVWNTNVGRANLAMTDKLCPDCGETKPKEEFYKNNKSLSGITVYCKECFKLRVADSNAKAKKQQRIKREARNGSK